jgi:hypothetical protein
MDYCFHSYPRELARQIAAQWDSAGIVGQLPPEDALTSLLSEAYQASLLREEDRAVVCRLMAIEMAKSPFGIFCRSERKVEEHAIGYKDFAPPELASGTNFIGTTRGSRYNVFGAFHLDFVAK